MINNKSNIEIQLSVCQSMLANTRNSLAKEKQLVAALKHEIEEGSKGLEEDLSRAKSRISNLLDDLSDAYARIYSLEVALTQAESDNEDLRSEVRLLHAKADDYDKANALLDIADKAQVDYKTIIEVLLRRKFSHNSDATAFLNDALSYTDAEIEEMGLDGLAKRINEKADEALGEKHKQEDAVSSPAPKSPDVKLPKSTEKKEKKENHGPSKRYTTTARVLRSFGIDKSELPENAKIQICKSKQNTWQVKLDSSYGSMVQRAVNYVLDDEKAFKVFLQDGRIEMHNNAIERMFRHLAMGRRNWLHTGSHQGAVMFSLFESCKLNDINFGDYIEDVLTRLMSGEQDFMSIIPCNYKSSKKVDAKAA